MKKVIWGDGKYSSAKKAGTYSSITDVLDKSYRVQEEQRKANEYLQKAMPVMTKAFELRVTSGQPFYVMRPLRYQTSVLKSTLEDDVDRSFYNTGGNRDNDSFVNVVKTINPGTMLVLKGLDPNLREFLFQDGVGQEHAISYDDRNAIMTQTDVFETVQKFFEGTGE